MIVIGQATVTGNKVVIDSPGAFNAFQALRITNYTQMVLILSNISGTSQSQEYLLPLQQMVYAFNNTSDVPKVDTLAIGGGISTPPTVLVEWSTEPIVDFTGTYPTIIGAPSAVPYVYINSFDLTTWSGIDELSANPFRSSLTIIAKTSANMTWSHRPAMTGAATILSGSGRTIHSTAAVYFDGTGTCELIEESWGPGALLNGNPTV